MRPPSPRRPRRILRATLLALVSLIAIAVIIVAVFIATFDANAYKPRIESVVAQATGRQLTLSGPIRLKMALHPTIELSGVALANPPGFSRTEMVTAQAIDVQAALLPLLSRRIEIDRLTLVRPDILLERNAKGATNWSLTPPAPATAPAEQTPAGPAKRTSGAAVSFGRIDVQDGTLTWRDDRAGQKYVFGAPKLELTGGAGDAPLHLRAQAVLQGAPLTVAADAGPLSELAGGKPPGATWPVTLALSGGGAQVAAKGGLVTPPRGGAKGGAQGGEWRFAVDARIPDLAGLQPYLPGSRLPPLRDITAKAQLVAAIGGVPAVSDLTLHAGASDLDALYPGMRLASLDATLTAMDKPLHAIAKLSLHGAPVTVTAQLGAPDLLLHTPRAEGAYPIDVAAETAGGSLAAHGGITDPALLTGLGFAIEAKSANLAALSGIAGRPLPGLRTVSLTARVADQGGLAHGIAVSGLRLSSAQGNLAGDAAMVFGTPASVHAALTSDRLDAQALLAAFRTPPGAAGAPAGKPPTPAPAPGHAPARPARLFPDTPIPFEKLRSANADITLNVADLKLGDEEWRSVGTHLVVQGGKLALPLSAQLPGGPLSVSVSVDASGKTAPATAMSLRAPALPLKSLLAAAGQPAYASGSVQAVADLHGAGETPHAIASTLDGTLSLSMSAGEIDTRVLERALGPVIARANPGGLLAKGGASEIRCFAMRLASRNGHAEVAPLVLSSTLITLAGGGRVDLGAETLDLQLTPQGRVGGTAIAVPLRVTGGLLDPHVAVNDARAAQEGLAAVVGALTGKPVTGIGQAQAPSCASALAEARGAPAPAGQAREEPKRPAAPTVPAIPKSLPKPADILRQFIR